MSDKKKIKTILLYAAGVLVLALCIAAGWFLPEAYGNWQDSRLIGQVQLSDRAEIDFLDGAELDQISRWQELEVCTDFFWENGEGWYYTVTSEWDEYIQACEEEAKIWCANGLLPLEEEQLDLSKRVVYLVECRTLIAGENEIPVAIFSFSLDDDLFVGNSENGCVTMVLDAETKKAYYMSAVGAGVREYMAEQLGYSSLDDLQRNLVKNGSREFEVSPDISGMDFAAVCGADRAVVTSYPGYLELEADIVYDSFRTVAQRRLIEGENYQSFKEYSDSAAGYGIAVMFGPTSNPDVFMECLYKEDANGSYWQSIDGLIDTELFCDVLYTDGYYNGSENW